METEDVIEPINLAWLSLQETAVSVLQGFIGFLPSLIATLVVLIVGWIFARLIRAASTRILSGLNRILERGLKRGLLANLRIPLGASAIFGEIAYWVTIFITLTIAARTAQLPVVSRWLNEIVIYLPSLLFGLATIVVGYVISGIVGEQVAQTAKASGAPHSALLGRLSQGLVFIVAMIIGLDQIGVDVTLFVTLAAVAIGAVLIGFSIAFGFGAREFVSNLISARNVRQSLNVGALVRIGAHQGEVLEITATQVALDTEDGRALIPCHVVEEEGAVIITLASPVGGHA